MCSPVFTQDIRTDTRRNSATMMAYMFAFHFSLIFFLFHFNPTLRALEWFESIATLGWARETHTEIVSSSLSSTQPQQRILRVCVCGQRESVWWLATTHSDGCTNFNRQPRTVSRVYTFALNLFTIISNDVRSSTPERERVIGSGGGGVGPCSVMFVNLYWMDPAHGPLVAFIVNLPLCACPILSKKKIKIFIDFSHLRFFAAPFVLHWYRCSPHSRSVCLIWMAGNKTNTRLVFNRDESVDSVWTKSDDWLDIRKVFSKSWVSFRCDANLFQMIK